eukprot:TRINITY_DN12207_c0_g1_i2.p1 TRINITY_DN12207_c0_g1~~TRINITY_DN12207_c0_g1_i2.p1  ORF type:complete len:183 (+),score=23.05 TRINITY_DN12207_c0_g1_i2:764-1312(+)
MSVYRQLLRRSRTDAGFPPQIWQVWGRILQARGDLDGAERAYRIVASDGWPASLEAQRRLAQLSEDTALRFLKAAREAVHSAAVAATHLAGLHVRPGSGALFGRPLACAAEKWYVRAARRGGALGAVYAGFSLHYGLCSGKMTTKGMQLARQFYFHAAHLAPNGMAAYLARGLLAFAPRDGV